MKKSFLLLTALCIGVASYAQSTTSEFNSLKAKRGNSTIKSSHIQFDNSLQDTNKVSLGKKGKSLAGVESKDSYTSINYNNFKAKRDFRRKRNFKGHWSAIELGYNSFGTSDFGMDYTGVAGASDFELNGFNWNLNINFLQQDIRLIGNSVGLVSGVGFEFNNYYFKKPGEITVGKDGVTYMDIAGYSEMTVEKSKLVTYYFNIPLLLEFQIPSRNHNRFYISAGVIGGVKLGQHSKIVTKQEGKTKNHRNDFNISPLRYSLTARLGYRNIHVFANYSMVSMFDKDQGPEIYPFSIGITLISF